MNILLTPLFVWAVFYDERCVKICAGSFVCNMIQATYEKTKYDNFKKNQEIRSARLVYQ